MKYVDKIENVISETSDLSKPRNKENTKHKKNFFCAVLLIWLK